LRLTGHKEVEVAAMAIITISKGAYTKGMQVAEMTAKKLGYSCVSREILLEASQQYDIPAIKLHQALESAPTVFSRMRGGKDKYIAYIENAFLQRMVPNDVVYHGFAGHFFVRDVEHAVKVRIIADYESRVQDFIEREGCGLEEAKKAVKKLDFERRSWAQALYGIDTNDPSVYDLVINVNRIDVKGAVDLILHTAAMDRFAYTPKSRARIKDLAIQAAAKAELLQKWLIKDICLDNGVLHVSLAEELMKDQGTVEGIRQKAMELEGVQGVEISGS
jgi:cytidylate kinase